MGSWSVYCGISRISITHLNDCVILPLTGKYKFYPATLPIFGEYDDYGGMVNIVHDDNTKLIEEYFGITIGEFVKFILNGKHTFDRDMSKIMIQNHFDELENMNFMWIDRQVYDFMIVNLKPDDFVYNLNGSIRELLNWNLQQPINKEKKLYHIYHKNIDIFENTIKQLMNLSYNLFLISCPFEPFILNVTPQDGEYIIHQTVFEEFGKINKSYIIEE